jgi:hypothetical protein
MMELALEEFKKLEVEGLYPMDEIVCWLSQFKPLSEGIRNHFISMYQYQIDDELVRLPPLNLKPSKEEKFLDLYKELEKLGSLYCREENFRNILFEFDQAKVGPEKVKIWLLKNEFLWNEYIAFYFDYVDDSKETDRLNVFLLYYDKSEIKLNRIDFRFTIKFLELYHELGEAL